MAQGVGVSVALCCLDLQVSFLFLSSAAALILLSPAGRGGDLDIGNCDFGGCLGLKPQLQLKSPRLKPNTILQKACVFFLFRLTGHTVRTSADARLPGLNPNETIPLQML